MSEQRLAWEQSQMYGENLPLEGGEAQRRRERDAALVPEALERLRDSLPEALEALGEVLGDS